MKKNELVSVIIPTYNRSARILLSVKSVLNQTYSNIELIVVDDGSTDDTVQKLNKIHDDRLIVLQQTNQGACAARNLGIEHARGKYIAFNDSDDTWKKIKLEEQMEKLHEKNADLVFCKLIMHKEKQMDVVPHDFNEGYLSPNSNVIGISTQTIMGKADIFKKNKFDIEMPRLQDAELMIRLISKYKIYCIDEGLVNYGIWQDSISNNPIKLNQAVNLILKKYPKLFSEHKNIYYKLKEITYGAAKMALKNGEKQKAKLFFKTLEKFNSKSTFKKYYEHIRNKILLTSTDFIFKMYKKE